MQVRRIVIAVAGLALLGLVGYLLLQVSGGSKTEISPEAKARALAEYQRRNAAQEPAPEPPAVRAPHVERTTARPPEPAQATNDDPPEPPVRRRISPPKIQPLRAGASAAMNTSSSSGPDDETKKQMAEIQEAYDHGDYPTAHELVLDVLKSQPRNVQMLRYGVSTSCAVGDVDHAREFSERLPERARKIMKVRCTRWGVDL